MKRMLAALLALLLISGCGARDSQENFTQIEPDPQPAVEEPVEEETKSNENTAVEIPVEIVNIPETEPFELEVFDGLVGDAVGYSMEIPTFTEVSAAEVIHSYYVEMVDGLVDYTEETIHEACLERHCMANVYGRVTEAVREGELLSVTYSYEVSYSDTDEPSVSTRTDVFDVTSGEIQE